MAADRLVGSVQIFTTVQLAMADIGSLTGTGTNNLVLDKETFDLSGTQYNFNKTGGSASDKVVVKAAAGAEHGGYFDNSPILLSQYTYTDVAYIEFQDVQFNQGFGNGYFALMGNSGVLTCERVLVKITTTGLAYSGGFESRGTVILNECAVWAAGGGEGENKHLGYTMTEVGSVSMTTRNCVAVGTNVNCFVRVTGTFNADNCISKGVAGYTGTITKTTCGSSDATGSIGFQNLTDGQISFISEATGDFHVNTDSVLLCVGTDESAFFTTDIDGDTINDWMIGFDYVAPPAAPTLDTPADGSIGCPLNQTVAWIASAGAATYRVQVATDAGFVNIVADSAGIAGLSFTNAGLLNNTQYFWRVNATSGAGTSGWSLVWNFVTIPLPQTNKKRRRYMAFKPHQAGVGLDAHGADVTNASQRFEITPPSGHASYGANRAIRFVNKDDSNLIYVNYGSSSVVATEDSLAVFPLDREVFDVPIGATHFALFADGDARVTWCLGQKS